MTDIEEDLAAAAHFLRGHPHGLNALSRIRSELERLTDENQLLMNPDYSRHLKVARWVRIEEAAKWVASMDHPSPEAKAALRTALSPGETA